MEQTQARSNIYALLSRVLLQELDDEMLEMILKDKDDGDTRCVTFGVGCKSEW